MLRHAACAVICAGALVACGSSSNGGGAPSPDAGTTNADGGVGGTDGGDGGAGPTALSFPQAIGGALFANPDTYVTIPVHVAVTGAADVVRVAIGSTVADAKKSASGDWIADVAIQGMADGVVDLLATASTNGGAQTSATAKLAIGRSGVELTDFSTVGFAGTPRAFRIGDAAWITWTDRSASKAEAWMRRIDGAGRWIGSAIPLVGSTKETLYARTAIGKDTIGVLYQQQGGPYASYIKIDDLSGKETVPSITLDPQTWYGSYGGAIAFDGSGYVATFRSNDGAGHSKLFWVRVHEKTGAKSGPIEIADSPMSDADGGFDPITDLSIAASDTYSVVAYVRKRYDAVAQTAIPKCQVTVVKPDGTIAGSDFCGNKTDFTWHEEAKVFAVPFGFMPVWTSKDLNDPNPNPPVGIFGTRASAEGMLGSGRGGGSPMVAQPEDREAPFFLTHADHFGTLAWVDHRTYANSNTGRIQLFAAPLEMDLKTHDEKVFDHARFIANTSELNGAHAGTNVLLIWLDERHGGGVLDPKPELWFETMWN